MESNHLAILGQEQQSVGPTRGVLPNIAGRPKPIVKSECMIGADGDPVPRSPLGSSMTHCAIIHVSHPSPGLERRCASLRHETSMSHQIPDFHSDIICIRWPTPIRSTALISRQIGGRSGDWIEEHPSDRPPPGITDTLPLSIDPIQDAA